MLEQTVHRCEKLIDPMRLFIEIDQSHIDYEEVQCQLSHYPEGCVILQPENKETGPGLRLPLMHLYKDYPESIVTVFPSDHFIKEENLYMRHVDLAYHRVAEDPSRIVLIGMEADKPEGEYGCILPGRKIAGPSFSGLREVRRLVENPHAAILAKLHREGGLWNTLRAWPYSPSKMCFGATLDRKTASIGSCMPNERKKGCKMRRETKRPAANIGLQ